MNPGLVVKLRPAGPWRIGPDSGARNRVDFIYHSDSLYSAMTSAMARLGSLDAWLDATARRAEGSPPPAVCFSSCFPFLDEIGFVVPPRTVWPPVSRALVAARVRWKSARFVPLGVVQAILAGQRLDENHWSVDGASECLVPAGRPGPFRTGLRWNAAVDRLTGCTERHSTACMEFRPGAGLWTIVSFVDEAAHAQWLEPVKAAFRLLADTGFGGERSRGWGRAESPEFIDGTLPGMILPASTPEPEATPVEQSAGESTDVASEASAEPIPEQPAAFDAEPPATPVPEDPEPIVPVTEPPNDEPPIEEPPAEPTEGMAAVRAPSGIEPFSSDTSPAAPIEPAPLPGTESDPPNPEPPAPEPGPPTPEPAPEPLPPMTEPEAPELILSLLPPTEPEPPVSDPTPVPEATSSSTEPVPPLPELAGPVADAEPVNPEVSSTAPVPSEHEPALEFASDAQPPTVEPASSPAPEAAPPTPDPQPPAPEAPAPGPRPPAPVLRAHWLLSLFTPAPDDAVDWRRGNYTVLARGGRVDSPAGSGELKKQIQMVAEGSVVYAAAGPCGTAADVAPDGFAHPVFRAGFAVSIPLPEVS